MVESSALLKRRSPKGYRGFESLPHRSPMKPRINGAKVKVKLKVSVAPFCETSPFQSRQWDELIVDCSRKRCGQHLSATRAQIQHDRTVPEAAMR